MVRGVRRDEAVLAVCVALTPRRLRALREEQWRADLRDGPGMGISTSALLLGAVCSSVTARFHESLHRGGILLSRFVKGENMKLVLGTMGAAVVVIGAVAFGIQATARAETPMVKAPMENRGIAGYEGWWNSTPASGNTEGLPLETVAVNTATGKIVDANNRARNDAGQVTLISDVDFDVVPDPNWPASSIVIIDTASGKVIEDFLVDERGAPIIFDEKGQPIRIP